MPASLKPVFAYLLPVAVAAGIGFWVLSSPSILPLEAFRQSCARPITYAVSAYDPRFGISREAFEQATDEAAQLWNEAAGKNLIEVSATGEVTVNLAYDERQEAVRIGENITEEQAAYDRMKASVDALRERYTGATRELSRRERAYEERVDAYDEKVAYWNAQGGAPPETYRELEAEKESINRERASLQRAVDDINELVAILQAEVNSLNALASGLNEKVDVYNAAVGVDFDQGNYVEDAEGKRITIFEFQDSMELKRVLAHEFGHALGIGHLDDPDSIMYSYNIGDEFVLTDADKTALAEACSL
ncbi:MAG: matrixin family metalloprotease [Patescibacteria group bacterium]